MKIVIPTATTTDKITGVAEYLINHIDKLQQIDRVNDYIIFTTLDNRYMFDIYANNFKEIVLPFRHKPWLLMRSLYHVWQNIYLPFWCKINNVDLVHLPNTMFVSPFMKSIISIHDIAELKTDKYSILRTYIRKLMVISAIKFAELIITVSNSTTRDLEEMGAKKLSTSYPGIRDSYKNYSVSEDEENSIICKYNVARGKYIIYVGTLMKHKNIPKLIMAFSHIINEAEDLKLLLIGAIDNAYDEIVCAIKQSGIEDRIIISNYVPNIDKLVLLKNARLFCLISNYEGFGMPVVEAQAVGVPVLVSNVSSLPEVAGEGAIVVDPENIRDIASGMLNGLFNDVLRNNLVEKGYRNVTRFTWGEGVADTLKSYEKVFSNGK